LAAAVDPTLRVPIGSLVSMEHMDFGHAVQGPNVEIKNHLKRADDFLFGT
jgi:hypothetical protein